MKTIEAIDKLIELSKLREIEPKKIKIDKKTYQELVLELRRFKGVTTYDITNYNNIEIEVDSFSWTNNIQIEIE